MRTRIYALTIWILILGSLAISGCATLKNDSDISQKEFPVVLYVSRQNGGGIDPINIVVSIDQKNILDRDFKSGGNDYHHEIKLVLKGGVHQLTAESKDGEAGMDAVFTVRRPTWILLDYWGKNHFQINISDNSFLFI